MIRKGSAQFMEETMRPVRLAVVAAALAAITGCAAAPIPGPSSPDIDFVRGCWVQKTAPGGRIEAFFRLLPEGADGDKPGYSGEIQTVTAGELSDTRGGLHFSRDGSSASWWIVWGGSNQNPDAVSLGGGSHDEFQRDDQAAARPGWYDHRAAFKSLYVPHGTLVVEATAERLKVTRNGVETMFDGERDGCD